jgi:hypothetical protein
MKGAYNYSDLNRVETAVSVISESLGLDLTTKTDWGVWDSPTRSEMERYLSNVATIKKVCPSGEVYPTLPDRMNGLTYESANNIEKTLGIAFRVADATPRSGELFCGEV